MKKTNKLLSLLTAVAISASAFTGLIVPASAEGETSGANVVWTFAAVPEGTKLTNSSNKEKEWYVADQDLGNGLTAHSAGTLDETKKEYANAFEVDRTGKTTFTVGEASEEVVGSLKFGGQSSATGRYFTYTPASAGTLTAYVKHGSASKPNTDIRKLIITQGEATPVEIATIGTDNPNLVGTANVAANQEVKITCDSNVALAKLVFTPSAASTGAPTTPTDAPDVPTTAPTTPTSAPDAPTTAPTTPTSAPDVPTTAPTTPTSAPDVPTTAPTTPTSAPDVPTTAPTTPTTAPTTPTTAPTTPTFTPVEEKTLYTMDIKSLKDATISKVAPAGDNVEASAVAKYSVLDFGTGNEDVKIAAIPELDGWGYVHKGYLAALTDGRQSGAHTVAAENAVYAQSAGNTGVKPSIYFIPENKDGLTVAAGGVEVYTFTAIITTTGGAAEGSPEVGFLSAADASDVTAAGSVNLAASGVNNQANKYNMTLVNDKNNGKYYIYVNGVLQKSGESTAIKGVYTRGVEKYIKNGIADLKLEQKNTAPNAVKVTFKGDADAELQKYDSVLSGTELTAPAAPSVSGKTFKEWQNDKGEAVTKFAAGETDTVYTAVYEEGSTISTVNVTTNAFAKVTLKAAAEGSKDIVKYTDVTGKVDFADITKGDYTYSIAKKGYTAKTGTFTLGTQNYALNDTAVLDDDHKNYVYYEADWTDGKGVYGTGANADAKHRTFSTALAASDVELPLTNDVPDVFTIHATVGVGTIGNRANSVGTWLLHSDKGALLGVHWSKEKGVFALTGWNGNATPQDSADTIDKAANSIKLIEPTATITGKLNVDFTVDAKNKSITVNYGGKTVGTLPIDEKNIPNLDPENENAKCFKALKSMNAGTYRENHDINVYELSIEKPDPMFMELVGDTVFAKVSGKTVTRTYNRSEAVITPDETFTWTVERANEITKKGAKFTLAAAPAEDMTAKAIVAAYNKGVLKSAKVSDVSIKAGQTEVLVESTADNAVVMLWDGLETMKPLAPAASVEEYTVKVSEETDMTGISIEDGVLSVTDAAKPGAVKITATGSTGKKASIIVEIKDLANVTPVVDGPNSYEAGQTGTYKVTSLVDEYKANVIDLFAPSFASDNTSVITVDPATGAAEAVGAGSANITITIGNPDKKAEVKIPVTVASYYAVAEATADSTVVDIANIKTNDAVTGYQVTTATADGAKVKQIVVKKADVTDNKITADTTGAAKVEVAPIYETTMNKKLEVPAATYNITVTANSGARTDVMVNDQMVINNLNQGSDNWTIGRDIPSSADYDAEDVYIGQGYAEFRYSDDKSGGSTVKGVKFVKAPSIVTRAKRVYVLGDSLVAKYYGAAPAGKEALVRTGWGDALQNYISGAKVTNLANSGVTAVGLLGDAFSNVLQSAQAGDVMVLESGYNDANYSNIPEMKAAMTEMVEKAYAKGLTTFIVPPNAGSHGTANKKDVQYASSVRELATELGEKTTLIDLSTLSYNFLTSRYTVDDQMNWATVTTYYNNEGDKLHSSTNAANCWAAIIANGLYKNDATKAIVNTEYTYHFDDGTENGVDVNALTVVPAE